GLALLESAPCGSGIMPNLCLCTPCVNGMPAQWKLSPSGASNGTCLNCANFNADFILSGGPGCVWTTPVTICASSATLKLQLTANANGGVDMTLTVNPQNVITTWQKTNVPDCLSPQSLPLISAGGQCNWPSSITIIPIPGSLSDLKGLTNVNCYTALNRGLPPGSNLYELCPPFL